MVTRASGHLVEILPHTCTPSVHTLGAVTPAVLNNVSLCHHWQPRCSCHAVVLAMITGGDHRRWRLTGIITGNDHSDVRTDTGDGDPLLLVQHAAMGVVLREEHH